MSTITLSGMDGINANLSRLTQGVRDRALKKAMTATLKPLVEAAKMHCPVDLGTLRDSISSKVSSKGSKGESVSGYMGPKTKVRMPVRTVKRGPHKGQQLIAIPTLYAHNVEFGHRLVTHDGAVVGEVHPQPFMRPAWDEEGADVAANTFADVLADEVGKEADKLNVRNVTRAANGVSLL